MVKSGNQERCVDIRRDDLSYCPRPGHFPDKTTATRKDSDDETRLFGRPGFDRDPVPHHRQIARPFRRELQTAGGMAVQEPCGGYRLEVSLLHDDARREASRWGVFGKRLRQDGSPAIGFQIHR